MLFEEVKALKTDAASFRDQRRENIQHNMQDTILEVLGQNSPEYRAHQDHRICIVALLFCNLCP